VIPLLERICGPAVRVIDPAPAIARQTERLWERLGGPTGPGERGSLAYYTSGAPAEFERALAQLGIEPGPVTGVVWRGSRIEEA
jgi:glutamate racemase